MTNRPWLAHYDPGVPAHLTYPAVPVFHFLDEAARLCPERVCLIFQGKTISYREVSNQTDRLAMLLRSLGIHKGERVGICMPNCPEFVLTYFAILKAGAVVVATNPLYTPPEIVHQVNDAGLQTIFCAESLYERIQSARPSTGLRRVFVTGEAALQSGDMHFNDLLGVSVYPPDLGMQGNNRLPDTSELFWYLWCL